MDLDPHPIQSDLKRAILGFFGLETLVNLVIGIWRFIDIPRRCYHSSGIVLCFSHYRLMFICVCERLPTALKSRADLLLLADSHHAQ